MKKLIILLFLLMSFNCFSQIQKPITKGNMILDGGGTFQSQKDRFTDGFTSSNVKFYFISLSPGFGYFIVNNLAIGLNTSLFYNGTANNKYYTLGAGPFVRYYFNNGFFAKGDASFSYLHNISSSTSNQTFVSLIPGLGYAFFLNPKVSLEPAVCYEFDNIELNSTNKRKTNSWRLEFKFSIFL